jgi:hypothetical protein
MCREREKGEKRRQQLNNAISSTIDGYRSDLIWTETDRSDNYIHISCLSTNQFN